MNKQQQAIQLRTRKLSLLIYDARLASRRTPEEIASAIGITTDQYISLEKGNRAPSLPELEALAFFVKIPLDHFWSAESLAEKKPDETVESKIRLHQLRDRIIGATLRKARTSLNYSYTEVSSVTGITEDDLKRSENGERSLTVPELEVLCPALNIHMDELFDQRGPIGTWRAQQMAIQKFQAMPPEQQDFVCKPVNKPYIDLAIRISSMSVEKIRSIAESLLEITF